MSVQKKDYSRIINISLQLGNNNRKPTASLICYTATYKL